MSLCDYGRNNKFLIHFFFSTLKVIPFFVNLKFLWARILDSKLIVCFFILQFTTSMLGSKIQLAPPTENVCWKAKWPLLTPKSGIVVSDVVVRVLDP